MGVARWWNERVVPRLVDRALKGRDLGALRDEVCTGLAGRVLEIGFGGGLNLRSLPDAVTRLDAVEPSDAGWRLSERRRARTSVEVVRVGLDGQRLHADDASYDAVLCTFTLCSIPDPMVALGEVRRVLRPGGTLHLLEHVGSADPPIARRQRRWEPLQRRVAGGCHLTRDAVALVSAAGLVDDDLRRTRLPGLPNLVAEGVVGRARRPEEGARP